MVTVSYHHMFDAKNAILIYFWDLAILRLRAEMFHFSI